MTVAHSALTPGSGIHVAHAVVYADAAARNAASPATGTLAYQTDTGQFYIRNASAWLLCGIGIGTIPFGNQALTGVKGVIYNSEIDDGNSGAADTIDWSAGGAHKSTLTGNCTYTFTSPAGVTSVVLKIVQGAGPYTVTWPASVKWAAGAAPTLSIANGAIDIFSFYYDGTNYYGAHSVKGAA